MNVKKLGVILLAALMSVGTLAACGAGREQSAPSEESSAVGMANPWREATFEEAAAAFGSGLFRAPENAENVRWSEMVPAAGEPLWQMAFELDGLEYCARAMHGAGSDDISGMYYEWGTPDQVTLAGWEMPGEIRSAKDGDQTAHLCAWHDPQRGTGYSLSAVAPGAAAVDLKGMAEAMCPDAPETVLRLADYYGFWADEAGERVSMTVLPSRGYGDASLEISWSGSAWDALVWSIDAAYDESKGELYYANGYVYERTYGEDGSVTEEKQKSDSAAGGFVPDGTGGLIWNDSVKEADRPVVFVRVPGEVPGPEAFVSEFFEPIGGYHEGTAGSSLGEAAAACAAFRFARDHALWNVDVPEMRDNMLEAWESMDGEKQRAFDENWMGVVGLIDRCLEDYDAVRGQFEDAGVGEEMEKMLGDASARFAWETLCGNVMTMGNSES